MRMCGRDVVLPAHLPLGEQLLKLQGIQRRDVILDLLRVPLIVVILVVVGAHLQTCRFHAKLRLPRARAMKANSSGHGAMDFFFGGGRTGPATRQALPSHHPQRVPVTQHIDQLGAWLQPLKQRPLLGHVCFKGTSYEIEHEYLYGTWPTAVKRCGKLCGGFCLGS